MGYNYTLSCCLLNNIDSNPSYLREILYYFVVHANDKIVIDDNGFILNIYGEYAKDNEQIATWLNVMSMSPSRFEKVVIDLSKCLGKDFLFFELCLATSDKRLIRYSKEGLPLNCNLHDDFVSYNGHEIRIFDRDSILDELKNKISIVATNSQVAVNGATISNSKNNTLF
ncbi:hypothetical protein [Parabacteroides goldsteinii]|uniref:hypothetical protein n=1 Tax=Parabacteroides goldsteinii TaxID=328812 RepID=UPI00321905FA